MIKQEGANDVLFVPLFIRNLQHYQMEIIKPIFIKFALILSSFKC